MPRKNPYWCKNKIPRRSSARKKKNKDPKPNQWSLALNVQKIATSKGNKASQHCNLFGLDDHIESHCWKKMEVLGKATMQHTMKLNPPPPPNSSCKSQSLSLHIFIFNVINYYEGD